MDMAWVMDVVEGVVWFHLEPATGSVAQKVVDITILLRTSVVSAAALAVLGQLL